MPRRRAALARAKRVEARTSHAVACLAVGAVFRVLMWLLLMLEGEFHMLLAPRCPTLSDCHLRGRALHPTRRQPSATRRLFTRCSRTGTPPSLGQIAVQSSSDSQRYT